jgi:UPF0755 protein
LKKWLIALVVLVGLGAAGNWKYNDMRRQRAEQYKWGQIVMPERMARVLQPLSVEELASRLEKTGKVRDSGAFIEAAQELRISKIAPGGYGLPAKAGPRELAQVFKDVPQYVKVTFPEGWTGAQMADRLAANGFTNAEKFRQMIYPPGQSISPWEGRLFPDTYYLPKNGSAENLIQRLNDRYKEVMNGFPTSDKLKPRGANGKVLSAREIVVLASLVEREARVPEERPLVAGVLVNRLKQDMRLQCDATVQYALVLEKMRGKSEQGHKARLLYSDLEVSSPYNTYRNAGLPPGAICNPGKSSLLAALEPRASEYLFYVMSPKLNRHRFSRTFPEHLRNKALAAQEKKSL